MNRYGIKALVAGALAVVLAGCMSPEGGTVAAKQADAAKMRRDTLAELYRDAPFAKTQIHKAVGYAVFSNVGVNLIFLSAGNGWGIARLLHPSHLLRRSASSRIGPRARRARR